jgi:hypothetical protein
MSTPLFVLFTSRILLALAMLPSVLMAKDWALALLKNKTLKKIKNKLFIINKRI